MISIDFEMRGVVLSPEYMKNMFCLNVVPGASGHL